MASEIPTRPAHRHPSVRLSRWIWRWPFLVWLGMAALAVWLYDSGGEYIRINAVVEVVTESVGPMETGRLEKLHVIPGQRVEAGDVVAELDTGFLEEELVVLAEDLQRDRAAEQRQYLAARQRLLDELRQYRLELAEAAARGSVYRGELDHLEAQHATGFVRREELTGLRADAAREQARIDLIPTLIAEIGAEQEALAALRAETIASYEAEDSGRLPSRISLLQREIDDMSIRVRQAGVVARIRREPGEIVDAGERVVDIITDKPPRILAFMDESDSRPVAVGDEVEVQKILGQDRFKARITAISPNVIALPDRASPIPDRVVRGRRLELVPMEATELTPGATLVVYLQRNRQFWKQLIGGGG